MDVEINQFLRITKGEKSSIWLAKSENTLGGFFISIDFQSQYSTPNSEVDQRKNQARADQETDVAIDMVEVVGL